MNFSTMVLPLEADITKFQKGMQNAVKEVDNDSKTITSKLGSMASVVGKALTGLAVAGIGAVITGMTAAVAETIKWKGTLEDINRNLGTTTQQTAGLSLVAKASGIEIDSLAGMLDKMAKNLTTANGQLGPAGKALQQLGISAYDSNGKMLPVTTTLQNIADKLKTMPDGLEKTTLEMDLFGKSGADLGELLDKSANGGIQNYINQASKVGLVMSDKQMKDAEGLKLAMGDLDASFKGIGITLGSTLTPALTTVAKKFNDWLGSKDVQDSFIAFGDWLSGPFSDSITNLADKSMPVLTVALKGVGGIFQWLIGLPDWAGIIAAELFVLPKAFELVTISASLASKALKAVAVTGLEAGEVMGVDLTVAGGTAIITISNMTMATQAFKNALAGITAFAVANPLILITAVVVTTTTAFSMLRDVVVDYNNTVTKALDEHYIAIQRTFKSYKEYNDEMRRAYLVVHPLGLLFDDNTKSSEELTVTLGGLTEAEWNALNSMVGVQQGADNITASYVHQGQILQDHIAAITVDTEAYWSNVSAQQAMIPSLAQLNSPFTAMKMSLSDVTGLFSDWTKEILFNKAAAGLDSDAALALAQSMGLVSDQALYAYNSLKTIQAQYDINHDGIISNTEATWGYITAVTTLGLKINGLTDKTVTITTNFIQTGALPGGPTGQSPYSGPVPQPTGTYNQYDPVQGYAGTDYYYDNGVKKRIPGRASGGHVNAGSMYWVGEKGPEPFIPDVSGNIVSNKYSKTMKTQLDWSNFPMDKFVIGIRDALLQVSG